ncbi:MAG: SUF system NifU family Fe-S cluster assembly protein [Erysipelotrichaceae bacterium]|nr:SUF system NifU family Fe-S cluster assembly protein [Erysipelotrichaceae bacterium]
MDKELKRSIILDNYQNPYHRERHDDEADYVKLNSRNVSCIDNIDLYIKIRNDKIEDISFEGEACVISISSTSIMSNLLQGKTIDEAIEVIKNYDAMIEERDYNENILGEAIVYDDVAKQPSRKKCATLSWHGLYHKLLELQQQSK